MKNRLCFILLLLLIVPFFTTVAVPKYMTKKNAITLALAIEKANYDGAIILAAYAMNRNNNYYVAVTLSNGRTERWYLNDIYKFSRDGKLNLRRNRVIVFPDVDSELFEILDKNLFHRLALKATAVREIYEDYGNPLVGQSLLYKIKEFNLIPPNDHSYGKDPYGYPYRYRVNLYNCHSILLSYRDILRYMKNRQFLKDSSTRDIRPLEDPYKVTSIVGFNKTLNTIYSQFGILVTFDRDIDLVPENFPVIIYETGSGTKSGTRERQFIIDVVLPNTASRKLIRLNGNLKKTALEYLNDVKVVPDSTNKCRSILRASFNYKLMDIPPYITKIAGNKIYITFFNITDQTVSEPPVSLADAEEVIEEKKKWLNISPTIQANTDFGRYYGNAVEKINAGYFDKNYNTSIEKLILGIDLLEKAGLLSINDYQLLEILSMRNSVRKRIVYLSMNNAVAELKRDNRNRSKLKIYLDNADEFSDSSTQQKKILAMRKRAKL